jgi:serine protease Do
MIRFASRRSLRLLPVLALPFAALAVGEAASASTVPPDSTAAEPAPAGYVRLVDDTGFITVVVPPEWSVIETAPSANDDGSPQPWIFAATVGLDEFNDTFASGVLYRAVPYQADPEAIATDGGLTGGCETLEVQPYSDPIFTGFVQVGTNCGEGGGTWNMIVASPEDQSFTAVVQVQIETPDDQLAFDWVLKSFTYAGDPTVTPDMMVPSSSVPGSSVPG